MNNTIFHISQIASIRAGYQFRKEAPLSPTGKYSVIQLRDSKEALALDDHEIQRYELKDIQSNDLLRENDILLRAKGNNHFAVLVSRKVSNTLASGLCLVLRCDESKVFPAFLTWYLNQAPAQSLLNKISAGTSIPIVNKKSLGDIAVPLLPLEKQKAIGELYQLQLKEEFLSNKLLERRRQLLNTKMLKGIEGNKF